MVPVTATSTVAVVTILQGGAYEAELKHSREGTPLHTRICHLAPSFRGTVCDVSVQ